LRTAFEQVGVEVVDGSAGADLVWAPAALAGPARAVGAGAMVLEGGRRAPGRRLLALPDAARPNLVLPLDQPAPLRYGIQRLRSADGRVKALRNRVAPALLERGLMPARDRGLALALRRPGPPFLLRTAAEAAGLPAEGGAFLVVGGADVLSRGALSVFAPGADAPGWVVKFARVPGHAEPFDRDAAGLGLATAAGGPAAAHAPRLLARFEAGGLHASVETAALGERLSGRLASGAPEGDRVAAVDRVAEWIVACARHTAQPPAAGAAELERLRHEVIPPWTEDGASAALLDGLDAVPAVLQHNDLGTWNVLADGDAFTAVDWESAVAAGLPLWDLLYFLAYALLALDRVPLERHEEHLVDAFLGRSPRSPLLFGWVRRAVADLALAPAVVGRLATTCWLEHGLSHVTRDAAVRAAGGEPAEAINTLPRRLARRWLTEPGLGAGWRAWQA
jgi:hypothetical protein